MQMKSKERGDPAGQNAMGVNSFSQPEPKIRCKSATQLMRMIPTTFILGLFLPSDALGWWKCYIPQYCESPFTESKISWESLNVKPFTKAASMVPWRHVLLQCASTKKLTIAIIMN